MTAGRDYDALLAAMLERVPDTLPEWTGRDNPADFGRVLLELFAHMGDILGYYQDRVATEALLGTATSRRSVIQHLRLIGYELRTAAPAVTTLLVSVPGTVTGTVTVQPGNAFATRSRPGVPSVRFEYTGAGDLPIDFGHITADPVTGRKTYDKITVEEGRLITREVLGSSDGRPGQRFPLACPRLILRPGDGSDLKISTPDGDWTVVDTLAFSQGGLRRCTVDIDGDDQATVCFGDGAFGAIPTQNTPVTATYRVGGGAAGNVGPGEVNTIVSGALAALGATVTNPDAARQGADREAVEDAVAHAPAVFRALGRAVTAADYEALVLAFPGVAKVRATTGTWNEVQLHVVPEGGGDVSDVLEAGLTAFLEDKRMLSQVVTVTGVTYRPVLVTAQIGVDTRYVSDDVVDAVRQRAAGLLALDAVDFGQPVYLSRFYEEIQNTPGVLYANITEFRRDDEPDPPVEAHGKIDFLPFELPAAPRDTDYPGGIRLLPTRGRR